MCVSLDVSFDAFPFPPSAAITMKSPLSPRLSRLSLVAVLVLASACTDSPVSPNPVPEPSFLSTDYECTADFHAGTLECGPVSPMGANGARLNLMLYSTAAKLVNTGGGSYSGSDKSNPDTMTYNMAVLNLIPQPIGTTDGVTSDTSRLVITKYTLTSPQTTATAQLDNPDGTATFVDSLNGGSPITYTNRPYMDYPGLLAQNDTSSSRFLRFVFSPSVTAMKFTYRIWTRVQYLYGYVTIAPGVPPVLGPGATTALTGTVYNQFGAVLADGITWSSSNSAVATVDASTGQVTAVGQGTATITATSSVNAQRTGTRAVIVDAAPAVDSTAPADGTFNAAPGTAIVVYFSGAVSVSGGSFSLGCTSGSQPFTISGSGTSKVTLYPISSLPTGDKCTATVLATGVSDVDANDGSDQLAENHSFWFVVEGFGG